MQYTVTIKGISPLIHHTGEAVGGGRLIDAEIKDITKRRPRGGDFTEADAIRLRQCEALASLWLAGETPTIPPHAFSACLHEAAKKLKRGPAVREGILVLESTFTYDTTRYGTTLEELQNTTQFVTRVVVRGSAIPRTRARFDPPWSAAFLVDADDQLADKADLEAWVAIAGQRIGLGDWRPTRRGPYGRFELVSIEPKP